MRLLFVLIFLLGGHRPEPSGWAAYLQHLPVVQGPVVDYRGRPIPEQSKHAGIIPFDVGHADLQQCADALMRLRAEYLFSRKEYDAIGFHFVGGQFYTWNDYCKGRVPVARGNGIAWKNGVAHGRDHASLRAYLDYVYAYASTLSLVRDLKPASGFAIGTVIIHPGSPGHCSIIIDERTDAEGRKQYRLVEGYTPAQSIYVLRNPASKDRDPWYTLNKGTIRTSSYVFEQYQLMTFEK